MLKSQEKEELLSTHHRKLPSGLVYSTVRSLISLKLKLNFLKAVCHPTRPKVG